MESKKMVLMILFTGSKGDTGVKNRLLYWWEKERVG